MVLFHDFDPKHFCVESVFVRIYSCMARISAFAIFLTQCKKSVKQQKFQRNSTNQPPHTMQNGINERRQRGNSVSKCLKIDKWRQFASCEIFQLPERKEIQQYYFTRCGIC